MGRLELYGWPVSPYTEKTRAWLRYKQIPTTENVPSLLQMRRVTIPAVGRFVMPTVRMPDGRWLQDSRVILDTLEAEHPSRPSEPTRPRQRIASALCEVYGDEWLIMAALHYRWHIAANAEFAISEFARFGFPWLPGVLSRAIMARFAGRMRAYAPKFGITPETMPGVESCTVRHIALLQEHLAQHRYLLGDRPCVGDFALFGSLWAHLERDVHSTFLFDAAPDVLAWTARLREGDPNVGEYLPDDEIPETLDTLLRTMVSDQWPYLTEVLRAVDAWCTEHPEAERIPRALGDTDFEIGGRQGRRRLITFHAWKAQRVFDRIDESAGDVADWVHEIGGEALSAPPRLHRQTFIPYRLVLDRSS